MSSSPNISVNDHSSILNTEDIRKLMANGILHDEETGMFIIQRKYDILGQQFRRKDAPTNVEITFDIGRFEGEDMSITVQGIVGIGAPAQAYFYAYERFLAAVETSDQP